MLSDHSSYATGLAQSVKKAVQDQKGNLVADDFINAGTQDYSAVLTKLKSKNQQSISDQHEKLRSSVEARLDELTYVLSITQEGRARLRLDMPDTLRQLPFACPGCNRQPFRQFQCGGTAHQPG